MPADTAVTPDAQVNEPNTSDATPSVAQPAAQAAATPETAEPKATPIPAPKASRAREIAAAMNLPADITQQLFPAPEEKPEEKKEEPQEPVPATPPKAAKPETDEEEPEDHPEGSPFKDPRVQERLGKNARQKRELKEKAEALERELEEAKAKLAEKEAAPATTPQGPQAPQAKGLLGNVTNEAQLDQWEEHATAQMEWCDANADGVTVGEGDNARFVEPQEIAKYRKDMEKVLLQAPKRRQQIRDSLGQHISQLEKFNAIAKEKYAALWNPESAEHKQLAEIGQKDPAIQQLLRDIPQLTNHPTINLILSRYVAGYQAEQNGQPAKVLNPDLPESLVRKHPPIAPVTAGPPSRSAAPNGSSKAVAEAMQHFIKDGGSGESMTQVIRAAREAGAFASKNSRPLAAV